MKPSTLVAGTFLACFFLLLTTYYPYVQFTEDIQIYQRIAENVEAVRGGESATLTSEYPPLATALFTLMASAGIPFEMMWLFAIALVILAVAMYSYKYLAPLDTFSLSGSIILAVVLLGTHLTIARNDIFLTALFFLTWKALTADRFRDSAIFLAVAICFKLTPLLLLPLLFVVASKHRWRELITGLVIGGVISAVVSIFVLGLSGVIENVQYVLSYHSARGVLVESTWSGVQMLLANLRGEQILMEFHHGAYHNVGLGSYIPMVASALLIAGLIFIYSLAWKRAKRGVLNSASVGAFFFLVLLWSIAMSPVFSPQYMMWFYPLISIWLIERFLDKGARLNLLALALSLVIMGVSIQWLGPLYYKDFLSQENLAFTLMLNVRNLMMFVVMGLLLKELCVVRGINDHY